MRKLLGDPKIDDSARQKLFKNSFGYYDKKIYSYMTKSFRKLFESLILTDELIEEFLLEATNTTAGNLDDGPSTFYKDYSAYKKVSKEWLDSIYSGAGWKVINYILDDKAKNSVMNDYKSVALTYLDHGQADGSTSAVSKYKKWMTEAFVNEADDDDNYVHVGGGKYKEVNKRTGEPLPNSPTYIKKDSGGYEMVDDDDPRLSKGGILMLDDYGIWDGETMAVNEYFHGKKIKIRKFSFSQTPSYIIKN